jgi:tripartite ATP-independent transporter DctP family solute receptor
MKRLIQSSSILPALLCFVLGLAAGCGGGSEETGGAGAAKAPKKITLTFPHALAVDHPVHMAIEFFKKDLAERSGGTIEIKIYPGSTIGSEQEIVDNVAMGTNDLAKISGTILETKVELGKVLAMPFLFRNAEHKNKVLQGEIGKELLDIALESGLKGVCFYDAGFRSFYAKDGFIESPEDLKGKKIRAQLSPMTQTLIGALGASAQPIAFAELYNALDTGLVDGAENNIPSYTTTNHYQVAPYFSFSEHVAIPDVVLINRDRWESFTAEQREMIQASADASAKFQHEIWQKEIDANMEMLKAAGAQFCYPDREPFRAMMAPVYEKLQVESPKVMEYVERIRAVE